MSTVYKQKITRLIQSLDLGIDLDVQVGGRPPTMASSEFLTNKEQGDWAERIVNSAIINSAIKILKKLPRTSVRGMQIRQN